jgi:hypothetical protein
MTFKTYRLSFTTGSLLRQESLQLAQAYLQNPDWKHVRTVTLAQNLLQMRTLKSAQRVCSEIISRLKTLNTSQLALLVQTDQRNQNYLLWLALCRRYPLIADFATEVLREKFITLKGELHPADFELFFGRKAEWHQELEQVKAVTRRKACQTLLRTLREADLLSIRGGIRPALPEQTILTAIYQDNPADLLVFPIFEADIKRRLA